MAEAKKSNIKTGSKKSAAEKKSPVSEVKSNRTHAKSDTLVKDKLQSEPKPVKTIKPAAKAGKRSEKSLKAAEAKLVKEERKLVKEDDRPQAKPAAKPTRSKLERRSKAYRSSYSQIDKSKRYSFEEATELIGKTSPVKFDATVELHVRLAVDPKQADQNVRDNVLLPAGSGKTIRVAALVGDDMVDTAKTAGADLVGESDIIKELEAGSFSFDVLIATPSQMPKLGKYARLLGPRGLMPNPKSGTVTNDVIKAISESKAGKVEYRVDSSGIIHIGIGKISFKPSRLLTNLQAVMTSINNNKPASIKGSYVIGAHLATTMGPSIRLSI